MRLCSWSRFGDGARRGLVPETGFEPEAAFDAGWGGLGDGDLEFEDAVACRRDFSGLGRFVALALELREIG